MEKEQKIIVETRLFLIRFLHISSVRVKICQIVRKANIIRIIFFLNICLSYPMPNFDLRENICKNDLKGLLTLLGCTTQTNNVVSHYSTL